MVLVGLMINVLVLMGIDAIILILPLIIQVYDTYRIIDSAGGSAIFGHAQIEPDVMLQDVIKMVDPDYNHEMVFFRNLLTENMGNDVECSALTDATLKEKNVGCRPTMAEIVAQCKDVTQVHARACTHT